MISSPHRFLAPFTLLAAIGSLVAQPAVPTMHREVEGRVVAEAEDFAWQTATTTRAWHRVSDTARPTVSPDGDPPHVDDASGRTYLEVLPDTRRTHDDPLVKGENITHVPGELAVLHYPVHFTQPGRYYFWARTYSTGTEDNGLHVGLDGTWPESGQRWQTTVKNTWHWDCRQRTPQVHTGVPMQLWLDVPSAGLHTVTIGMREDGTELDKWILARDETFRPESAGPAPTRLAGVAIEAMSLAYQTSAFRLEGRWAAIRNDRDRTASIQALVPTGNTRCHVFLEAGAEAAGPSTYELRFGNRSLEPWTLPAATTSTADPTPSCHAWEAVDINEGEGVEIRATIGSAEDQTFTHGFWSRLIFYPFEGDPGKAAATVSAGATSGVSTALAPVERQPDAAPQISIHGELKQWHTVTLDLAGPFAHEGDFAPNPFTDYAFDVTFTHESGTLSYQVPGYFAADGHAAETGAAGGTAWRAHLSPDRTGRWDYVVHFRRGPNAATYHGGSALAPYDGLTGSFEIAPTDKHAPDFRARGRLGYTGERYLRFAGDGTVFLKAGADAPETYLAYADFDNTIARKPNVPLKTWAPHLRDWQAGDPTWHDGKGKGIIGSLNYLAAKGANAFSFLTYNAGGDGDNVWPFVDRDDKLHYDVSKLAQWEIVFAHAQRLGLYLHFKLQENENDDHRAGGGRKPKQIPEAMDGGETGPERRLYFREMVARFGHHLALNWNFGEENTQSTEEQVAMFNAMAAIDPYGHHRVLHTFPRQQDEIYPKLLGDRSNLTGISAQNHWSQAHAWTSKWIEASAAAGRPWVVANDEQNPAALGVPPDPGYEGFDGWAGQGDDRYDLNAVRKYTLWGNLMAGGAGVEYYFGYRLPQNDLLCEDLRSRDRSWDYCRHALTFFANLPLDAAGLQPADTLVGTDPGTNGNWCLADPTGDVFVIYLPEGGEPILDLNGQTGTYTIAWFNPRTGRSATGTVPTVSGGASVRLGTATVEASDDWALVVQRR